MGTPQPGNAPGEVVGPTSPSGKRAEAANPAVRAESPAELGAIDALQLVLDLAGMIPGAGAIPDLINAAISLCRGDFVGALFSAGSAIPVLGDAAGAAKILKNSDKYLEAAKVIEQKVLPMLPQSMRKRLEDYLAKMRAKIDEVLKKDAPQSPPKPKEDGAGGGNGGKSKGKKKRKPSRRCELVPYEELECDPGQEAHHVVPDWMLRTGKRGGPERIPGMPSLADGPAICLESGSGKAHNTAHKHTDRPAQRVAMSGKATGVPGTITLGQGKVISARAIEKATGGKNGGGCDRQDIQKQLDEKFKAHNDTLLRGVKDARKVSDSIRDALNGGKD